MNSGFRFKLCQLCLAAVGRRLTTYLAKDPRQPSKRAFQSGATPTDRVGFEPTVPLRAHRFSRPAVSTAHAPVHTPRRSRRRDVEWIRG